MFQNLRARLLLSYLAVMATILSVFGTGVYVVFSRNLNRQLNDRLITLAQSATPSFTAVRDNGSQYLNDVLEVPWRDLFNRDRQSLEWFDANGNLIGRKGVIKLNAVPKTGTRDLLQEDPPETFRTHTLSVFISSRSQSEPPSLIGFIRASQSTQELKAAQNQLFWILIFGGMMTLILIGLGGFWLTQKAIEPIEASFQKLKQFTADASHELRSPLTAIKASVDLMRNHPERVHPKDAKKLAAIAGATQQMSHTLEDLLFLARNDANPNITDTHRQRTHINIQALLQNCFVLLEPLASDKKITFIAELESEIYLLGDKAQLSRLFSNLLENALQYTSEGGKVSLHLHKHNRVATIEVRDSGIGIASDQIPYVFDRFWRANKARTRREGGTGLGLAIAQTIAQSHGGKITVQSEIDVGSCFQVRLPVLATGMVKKIPIPK
jgi:two-component system, OmpR family, manganese sensing sensor histidine kinase